MVWFLANWKSIAAGAAIMFTFYAGWHSHTIYSGYREQKEEVKIIKKLGEGSGKIIDFNMKLSKEISNAKDKCLSAPIPPGIKQLLH